MNYTRPFHSTGLWLAAAFIAAGVLAASAQSTNAPMVIDASTIRTISDRNIFDPNRTPHTTYARRSTPQREPDSFSFVGSMSYEKGDFAFFDGTMPEFHKAVQVDDSISTFKVAAIDPDSVTLVENTNEIILQLGDQMRDDGTGKFVPASSNAGYNSSSTGGGTRRNSRFSFRRNRNGFNRGGNNPGGPGAAAPATPGNQPPSPDDNMTPPDDNSQQPPVIIVPVDPNGQPIDQTPDNTTPNQ